MVKDDFCSGCAQRHDCKSIYQALGRMEGSAIAWKVVFAFLAPLAVFIAVTAGLEMRLRQAAIFPSVRIVLVFVLSAAAAVLTAWLIRTAGRKCFGWDPPSSDREKQNDDSCKDKVSGRGSSPGK